MTKSRVIDLFAGVGGFSLGFTQAGFDVVYANEYDKDIAASYSKNHPGTSVDSRDIGEIDIAKTFKKFKGNIDVVIGGPPCQGFSQKGSRIGLRDPRNYLFQKFVEVVDLVKPSYFVLENVPNILTAENGYFKNQIIEMFEDLGYSVSCEVLKAEDFGVPQIRRRAIFVGSKKTVSPADLPKGTSERVSVRDAIDDLPELLSGEGSDAIEYPGISTSKYQEGLRAQSTSIRNHISTNHSKIALQRLKMIPPDGSKADLPPEHQTKSIHSGTWSRINPNGLARTITTRFDTPSSGQFTLPYQDRCLTVREAARIQSFPDTFVFYGSKTCQMLQVGNAVPPKLSKAIALEVQKAISRN